MGVGQAETGLSRSRGDGDMLGGSHDRSHAVMPHDDFRVHRRGHRSDIPAPRSSSDTSRSAPRP